MCAAEDAESRVEALRSFERWGGGAAFEPAETALDDPRPAVRRAAASALGRIDDPRSAEALVKALGDDDRSVRKTAASSIGAIGLPALEPIVQSLDDPTLEDGALLALEELPVDPQADRIRTYARDHVNRALHYNRLWRQARSLARRDNRAQLLADTLHYVSEHHGFNALRSISVLDETGAVSVAVDSLKSTDPVQRANALETLDSIADRDLLRPVLQIWEPGGGGPIDDSRVPSEQVLRQCLQDADPWLRACAALVTDVTNMSGIRSQLDELAKTDPDPTVRETAAAALEGDKPMKTLDTLSLMERILFLKRVPLFANLPPAEVKQVAAIAHEHLFVDGESIAEQGESGDELYVIVSGQVRVVVTASGEEETELALRGTGEYVGEMAVISQKPRMAKLVAVGEVRALCIEQKQFEGILRERPDTSLAVMQVLCDRLRERENAAQ
jgi:HEAT repeat protein